MKNIVIIFLFILSSLNWAKASDIKEFEVEGFSIGDSILKFIKKNEIIDNGNYGPDSKFIEVEYLGTLSKFEYLTLHINRKDPNYIIHAIRGINIVNNKTSCLSKKKEIFEVMKKVFSDKEFYEAEQNHYFYKNSMQYTSQFYLGKKNTIRSDLARVECVIMDQKDLEIHGNVPNTLELIIYTENFAIWLESL